jgi:hypothetical protein
VQFMSTAKLAVFFHLQAVCIVRLFLVVV